MNPPKIVIDTDVLADHLLNPGPGESSLRMAMKMFFCYTTVYNAIELFALARTEGERTAVEGAMGAMKILGLNAKSARKYGEWFPDEGKRKGLHWLIAGICTEAKLPLLTGRPGRYRAFPGVPLLHPSVLRRGLPPGELLHRAGNIGVKKT